MLRISPDDVFMNLGITKTWIFAAMAFDRYVVMCYPLQYGTKMSHLLCVFLTARSALCGLTCALIYTVFAINLPHCGPNEINHFFCEIPAVLKLACVDTSLNEHVHHLVNFILSFILFLIPLLLILVSQVCIFMAILKIHPRDESRPSPPVPHTSSWSPWSVFYA